MRKPDPLRLLVAYPYLDNPGMLKHVTDNAAHLQLVVDSGAYTAWKAGTPIKLDDYCRFLDRLPVTPWRYFALDMIGDPAGTMRNYETMLKRGFKPIPVFTRGEDLSMLEDYYRTADVVGIGGLVGTRGNKGFVNALMKAAGKRRTHWLGFTDMAYMKHYRPYMCDCSSWRWSVRYALVRVYAGKGRFENLTKKQCATRLPDPMQRLLRSYGVDPMSLAKEAAWKGERSIAGCLAGRSYVRCSNDVQKHLGVNMFLATASLTSCEVLLGEYKAETLFKETAS